MLLELKDRQWFRSQHEMQAEKIRAASGKFKFSYFLTFTFHRRAHEKANIVSGISEVKHYFRVVANKYRLHLEPFAGWDDCENGHRFHIHAIVFSDKRLRINEDIKKHWRHGFLGASRLNPALEGVRYVFENHFREEFKTFCGCRRSPCVIKSVRRCVHHTTASEI